MKVRRGEVVLVDFPYSDQMGSKVRPALVVQADALNQRLDDTILALITSSRYRSVGAATQVVIDIATGTTSHAILVERTTRLLLPPPISARSRSLVAAKEPENSSWFPPMPVRSPCKCSPSRKTFGFVGLS